MSFSRSDPSPFIKKLAQFNPANKLAYEHGVPVIVSHSALVDQRNSLHAVKELLRCFQEQISQEHIGQSLSALSHLHKHYQSYGELKSAKKINRVILVAQSHLLRFNLKHGNSEARSQFGIDGAKVEHDKKAFKSLSQATNLSVSSMTYIGNCFLNGEGVDQDELKAFEYFYEAAAEGNAEAQNSLGYLYLYGQVVPKEELKAFEYFYEAAARGNAEAQNSIANLYLRGEKVPKDEKKAFEYYQLSAAQNDSWGLFNLGISYKRGRGTEKDELEAIRCHEQAAEMGNTYAQYYLGRRFASGRGVEKNLVTAFHYFESAANAGHPDAQFELALCYMDGKGVEKDDELAKQFLKLSAAQDSAHALVTLGEIYEEGKMGFALDLNEAFKSYKKAFKKENEHPQALFYLAECFRFGKGVKQNPCKAFKFIQRAALCGDHDAQIYLFESYFGETAAKDERKAIEFLTKFALEGNPGAQVKLAGFYIRGDYLGKDLGKAEAFLKMASRQGNIEAQEILEELKLSVPK